jgi:pilus assembly protein CpaB
MRSKIWIPLALSIFLGLGAAVLAMRSMHKPQAAPPPTDIGVLSAARDIDPGTELTAADLVPLKYPVDNVPPEACTNPQSLSNRITIAPLIKGQIVTERFMAPQNYPAGLQSLITPGMRAITIEVSEFSGVAGLITPGVHIDLIANVRDDRVHETGSRMIVQDLRVLAVGRSLGSAAASNTPGSANTPPPPPANSVTVLATPMQAQAISLAAQGGRPWLALRGFKDYKHVETGITRPSDLRGENDDIGSYLASLLGGAPTAAAPTTQPTAATTQPATFAKAELPQGRVVRIINGTEETKATFQPDPLIDPPTFGGDATTKVPPQ